MSMDTIIFYKDMDGHHHGAYVNDGVYSKEIGKFLHSRYGQSRSSLVEWVYQYHNDFSYHGADTTWDKCAIMNSGADQFLFIDGQGCIIDITRKVQQDGQFFSN